MWIVLVPLCAMLLFGLVTSQYAGAVAVARTRATVSAPQVVGGWHSLTPYRLPEPSRRIVKVLCPTEVGLLLKAIARATQLSGMVAFVYLVVSNLKGLKSGGLRALKIASRGATIFGAASIAPEVIRGLSVVSLGFVPF